MLGSACQFPMSVARSILQRGGTYAPSMGGELHDTLVQHGVPHISDFFNVTAIDVRARMLATAIEKCLKRHPKDQVLFETFGGRNV